MFKIIRSEDSKTFEVESYKFVVFDENGRGKEMIENPKAGTSLILPPFTPEYLWLTSPITEVIDEHTFKTLNSTYKIEKL